MRNPGRIISLRLTCDVTIAYCPFLMLSAFTDSDNMWHIVDSWQSDELGETECWSEAFTGFEAMCEQLLKSVGTQLPLPFP